MPKQCTVFGRGRGLYIDFDRKGSLCHRLLTKYKDRLFSLVPIKWNGTSNLRGISGEN